MKHVTAPHTTKKEKSRLPITTKESMGLQCLLPACLVAVEETFISAARVLRERHGATNSALGARVRGRWLITPDSSTQHRRSTRIRPSTKKNREPLPQSERRRLPGNICGNRDSRAKRDNHGGNYQMDRGTSRAPAALGGHRGGIRPSSAGDFHGVFS